MFRIPVHNIYEPISDLIRKFTPLTSFDRHINNFPTMHNLANCTNGVLLLISHCLALNKEVLTAVPHEKISRR
jgi:hypothetical protein